MAERAEHVQAATSEEDKQIGSSDDKCIGNRKVRTVILCLLLLAFSIFAAGYLEAQIQRAKDKNDVVQGCKACDDAAEERIHGANLIFAGLFFEMFFLVITMIVAILPQCDVNTVKMGRIPAGLGLIFGATLYILGWIWYIGSDKEVTYDFLTDDAKEEQDAICFVFLYTYPCTVYTCENIFRSRMVWGGIVIFCNCHLTRY